MATKKNQMTSAVDRLVAILEKSAEIEGLTLSAQVTKLTDDLRCSSSGSRILAGFGFSLSEKPEREAFKNSLKAATRSRYSNLEAFQSHTEKDQTSGKMVTFETLEKVPAFYYTIEDAAVVSAALVAEGKPALGSPLRNKEGEIKRVFTAHKPIYQEIEVSYKDAAGKTQKKKTKVQTGSDPYEVTKYAYEKRIWFRKEVIAGLRELIFMENEKSSAAARLLIEFEQGAKENAGK